MSTWAILPVKGFDRGKSRLMPALAPAERRALAGALFGRALGACMGCTAIDHVLVASDSARVLMQSVTRAATQRVMPSAPPHGAPSARLSVLLDPPGAPPFARVLDAALAHAHARGAMRAVIAMGDLPLVRPRDLAEVLARLEHARIAVAPDRARRGVGAIACTLPAPLPMQLGHRDSLDRTLRAARERALPVALVVSPRLARDLDTSADLLGLREPALAALLGA